MREAGHDDEAIRNFLSGFRRLESGESVMLPSSELEPAGDVPALEDLRADDDAIHSALERLAVVKLNGGLATTMGLRSPKSLVEARDGHSFLDIIVGQTLALRRRYSVQLPLILMDSEATQKETLAALERYDDLAHDGVPLDFLQSMVPKLEADSHAPVTWSANPALEWNPPGHGDVYGALRRSGLLATLLERGVRYAMIANSDNLGATVDPRIPAHMAREEIPFLMEVVQGTEADRKGGHIARRISDGQLVLRETAQTPEEDEESFRDFRHWRYYNTNNLWVDLRVLHERLEANDGVFELPLIVNRKTVDPRDKSSTPVIQLESAMGAAIANFEGASLLLVPRTRFVPVKTTNDLLVLRSDVYSVNDELLVEPLPERAEDLPFVDLDSDYYKLLDEFEERFPHGAPSLREAQRLVIHGDVRFGSGVTVRGSAEIDAPEPLSIDDGATIGD
jgi:UTP--glucose-1-phosphate uridylyltransferase